MKNETRRTMAARKLLEEVIGKLRAAEEAQTPSDQCLYNERVTLLSYAVLALTEIVLTEHPPSLTRHAHRMLDELDAERREPSPPSPDDKETGSQRVYWARCDGCHGFTPSNTLHRKGIEWLCDDCDPPSSSAPGDTPDPDGCRPPVVKSRKGVFPKLPRPGVRRSEDRPESDGPDEPTGAA